MNSAKDLAAVAKDARVARNYWSIKAFPLPGQCVAIAIDNITVRRQAQAEIRRLNRDLDMAILYISHDLLSVAALCHRVAILRDGEIVECDSPDVIFDAPRHPYTQRLIAALPGACFGKTLSRPLEILS